MFGHVVLLLLLAVCHICPLLTAAYPAAPSNACNATIGNLPVQSNALFAIWYNNSAFADSSTTNTLSFYNHSSTASFRFPDSLPQPLRPTSDTAPTTSFSFQLHGHLLIPTTGNYTFNCTYNASSPSSLLSVHMWVNDHLMCPNDANNANVSLPLTQHSLAHIRVHVIQQAGWTPSPHPQLQLVWSLNAHHWQPIPIDAMVACLTDARVYQMQLKERQLALGWETLNAFDLLSHTLMPHALSLAFSLYQLSTQQYRQGWYVERAVNGSATTQQLRIGNRTWTGEQSNPYTSLHVAFNGLNISLQTTTDRAERSLSVMIQGTNTCTNYSDYRVVLTTSYLWDRHGSCQWMPHSTTSKNVLDGTSGAQQVGECVADGIDDVVRVYSYAAVRERSLPGINQTMYGPFVAFAFPDTNTTEQLPTLTFQALTTNTATQPQPQPQSHTTIHQTIQHAASQPFDRPISYQQQQQQHQQHEANATTSLPPYPTEQYNLVQTSLAWLSIFTPFEGIITVVSRRPSWNFGFGYTLFEWDSFLAVHMMASFGVDTIAVKQLAIATLLQVVKTKVMSSSGLTFTPNYLSGTIASRDRTEPPLGAKVLDEVIRMWSGEARDEVDRDVSMLTALCYDDLWSEVEWFRLRRRFGSAQLIGLGSDPNPPIFGDIDYDDMQAARYESGLDNSPMYDDDTLYDKASHHMQQWDVGMTALYLTATLALQSITNLTHIGTQHTQQLHAYYHEMAPLTARLWQPDLGLYVNVRVNDSTPQPRLSPTSFFPMLALLPTVAQAEAMMSHLTNVSEFCVSAECAGQPLPSISRSDASYADQSYWRGRQWGPHTMIVYWSLSADKYSGSALIDAVRRQLVVQASGVYRDEWRMYHHVHENYDGNTAAGCNVGSSDPLYTWGALNAYVALVEWKKQAVAIEAAEKATRTSTSDALRDGAVRME